MPEYEVVFTRVAREGLAALDKSEREQVVKQLEKLKRAPGLGEPLGNKLGTYLAGLRKLRACQNRVRIIYEIMGRQLVVTVIAIGPRADAKVYRIADAEVQRRRLLKIAPPAHGVPSVLPRPSSQSGNGAQGSASPP